MINQHVQISSKVQINNVQQLAQKMVYASDTYYILQLYIDYIISHFLETAQTYFIETFESKAKALARQCFHFQNGLIYAHSEKTQQGPHGVVSGPVLPDSLTLFPETGSRVSVSLQRWVIACGNCKTDVVINDGRGNSVYYFNLANMLQLWEVELLFLVYYVSNYILKYFATSNADDKFQQIISSWRLFMNYSLTQEGQKYDFDRIRPQSTIQSRYLIFQKGKIEITTCNKRTAMTKINAVEDVQGRSTNSLNKLRQF
ncbi:Hypothetical_protein [Hexamita inflata]|uniref:Hypothetical_protein n=1 Tax=Hexamita inflata TaxID=28002 RepID=A0ABP1IKD0_9EUKA